MFSYQVPEGSRLPEEEPNREMTAERTVRALTFLRRRAQVAWKHL